MGAPRRVACPAPRTSVGDHVIEDFVVVPLTHVLGTDPIRDPRLFTGWGPDGIGAMQRGKLRMGR